MDKHTEMAFDALNELHADMHAKGVKDSQFIVALEMKLLDVTPDKRDSDDASD